MFDMRNEYFYGSDRVQDMLLQNRAPWHIGYFYLKELKKQLAQEGLSDLSLKQVIKPSRERCSPNTQRKEHCYL